MCPAKEHLWAGGYCVVLLLLSPPPPVHALAGPFAVGAQGEVEQHQHMARRACHAVHKLQLLRRDTVVSLVPRSESVCSVCKPATRSLNLWFSSQGRSVDCRTSQFEHNWNQCLGTHTRTHARAHTHKHTCTHGRTHACTHTHACTRARTHTRTHTHTHTRIPG